MTVDANELATLDLFQYMIGNTDWSAIFQHNIVIIREADGTPTPVAFDFDFSGSVTTFRVCRGESMKRPQRI